MPTGEVGTDSAEGAQAAASARRGRPTISCRGHEVDLGLHEREDREKKLSGRDVVPEGPAFQSLPSDPHRPEPDIEDAATRVLPPAWSGSDEIIGGPVLDLPDGFLLLGAMTSAFEALAFPSDTFRNVVRDPRRTASRTALDGTCLPGRRPENG